MNTLKQYKINFVGLPIGNHPFTFRVEEGFFACFEESEISQGQVNVELVLEKKSNMLVLDFQMKGEVEVVCDRCMELYNEAIDLNKTLYVKFGDAYVEQTEDIITIPDSENHVDISHFVYEFLHLGLPIRRVHSTNRKGEAGCDPEIMKKLEKHLGGNKGTRKICDTDSAWKALSKLKF